MENEKSLAELKAMLDAARSGQLIARNELSDRLNMLGFKLYSEIIFQHPTEEDKTVWIHIQDCYGNLYRAVPNDFLGFFEVDVAWYEPHCCDESCSWDCDQEDDRKTRPATAEELVEVLKRELLRKVEEQEAELRRNWELAKAFPTEEELAAERRRVEDFLRKNPRYVLAVVKLLKKIQEV